MNYMGDTLDTILGLVKTGSEVYDTYKEGEITKIQADTLRDISRLRAAQPTIIPGMKDNTILYIAGFGVVGILAIALIMGKRK